VVVACVAATVKYSRGDWMGAYSVIVDVSIALDHLIRACCVGVCLIPGRYAWRSTTGPRPRGKSPRLGCLPRLARRASAWVSRLGCA
jgi:hypothetical protein